MCGGDYGLAKWKWADPGDAAGARLIRDWRGGPRLVVCVD